MGGPAGLGIGGFLILLVLSLLFGTDLFSMLGLSPGASTTAPQGTPIEGGAEEEQVNFLSFVLDDAQAMWAQEFAASDLTYQDAQLVLYRQLDSSACGYAQAEIGPFYCPLDQKVYIDLSFYDALRERFGAPGDFAQAYVLAHELGHHVQNLLGVADEVRRASSNRPDLANDLSVAMELQADCYAGVWGSSVQAEGRLERGDLEEGLQAAAAVGDDRLQRQGTGRVNPESFTHGTSEQRMQWFQTGFSSGDPDSCDTFTAAGY